MEIKIVDLTKFNTLSLSEMDNVSLMRRVDTKFIFHTDILQKILSEIQSQYFVLSINNNSLQKYATHYFDDEKLSFYNDHHNKKQNRLKIRMREYLHSKITFLEIKNKIKGQTIKNRIQIKKISDDIAEHKNFLNKHFNDQIEINKTLSNTFDRITFVNKAKTERLTIDLNLSFSQTKKTVKLNKIAVDELKKKRIDRNSLFYQLMKQNLIRPTRISKYCIGLLLLDPLKKIKYNRFKQKLILLNNLQKNR